MAKTGKENKKTTPTASDNPGALEDVILKETFIVYMRWKALPPILLNFRKGKKILTDDETCATFGIDDQETKELMAIKSQAEFAERYKVSPDTLTDWNKKMETRDMLADSRRWARKLTKNVVLKVYENAVKNGGMSFKDREMFFKVINHWNEKQSIELDVGPSLFEILKKGNHDRRPRK